MVTFATIKVINSFPSELSNLIIKVDCPQLMLFICYH